MLVTSLANILHQPQQSPELSTLVSKHAIHGIDLTYVSKSTLMLLDWCANTVLLCKNLFSHHAFLLIIHIWIPSRFFPNHHVANICHPFNHHLHKAATCCHQNINAFKVSCHVAALRELFILHRSAKSFWLPQPDPIASLSLPSAISPSFMPCLNEAKTESLHKSSIFISSNAFVSVTTPTPNVFFPYPIAAIKHPLQHSPTPETWNLILDPNFPATEPTAAEEKNLLFVQRFGVPFQITQSLFWYSR